MCTVSHGFPGNAHIYHRACGGELQLSRKYCVPEIFSTRASSTHLNEAAMDDEVHWEGFVSSRH